VTAELPGSREADEIGLCNPGYSDVLENWRNPEERLNYRVKCLEA
jgi:hypothetical protein